MINISINLSKLPKGKITEAKNGDKWINLTVNENREIDQYGNSHHVIIQQTKDERTAKEPKIYVGNGKEFKFNQQGSTGNQQGNYQTPNNGQDDLPF